MKKHDSLFFLCVLVCFLPFFLSDAVYDAYKQFNASHGMVMSLSSLPFSPLWAKLSVCVSAPVFIIVPVLAFCRVPLSGACLGWG